MVETDFSAWFEREYRRLVRFATAICGSVYLAEDLVQDAYIRARAAGASPSKNIDSYVRQTIVNLSRSRHRRRVSEEHALARHGRADEAARIPERDEAVWAAIARLPARQRAVLALRYYEDLTEVATAALLGISVGNVKKASSRGVTRLRSVLEGMDDDER